jgi:hypothetical protein
MGRFETDPRVVQTTGMVLLLVGLGLFGAIILGWLTGKFESWVFWAFGGFGVLMAVIGYKLSEVEE